MSFSSFCVFSVCSLSAFAQGSATILPQLGHFYTKLPPRTFPLTSVTSALPTNHKDDTLQDTL